MVLVDRKLENNHWHYLTSEALSTTKLTPNDRVIVGVAQWLEQHQALLAEYKGVGICLEPDENVLSLEPSIHNAGIISIRFTQFGEGRGYSQARLLRSRLNYKGEIRAIGDVTQDRVAQMERCGINAFELDDDVDVSTFLDSLDEVLVLFQADAIRSETVQQRRGHRSSY